MGALIGRGPMGFIVGWRPWKTPDATSCLRLLPTPIEPRARTRIIHGGAGLAQSSYQRLAIMSMRTPMP
jgi:hypothetical protein